MSFDHGPHAFAESPLVMEMVFNRVATAHAGQGNIDLADGYPDTGTPKFLLDLFLEKMQTVRRNDGEPPYGIPELREAIADDLYTSQGVRVDPAENVTVTGSASEAITSSILALARRNTAIIFLSPHFPVYATAASMATAVPQYVPVTFDGTIDVDRLVYLLETTDASTVVLNTPHNPTAAVLDEFDCARVMATCRRRNISVISDEVFGHLSPHGKQISLLAHAGSGTSVAVVSDSGKKFNLRGLRLGYVIADKATTQRIRVIQQTMTYRISMPLQSTVAAGLRWANSKYYSEMRAQILQNAGILASALRTGLPPGARINNPAAGCFLLAAVPHRTGTELAKRIAQSAEVLTLPGSAFASGRRLTTADDFVRLSLARSPDQISKAADRLSSMNLGLVGESDHGGNRSGDS